MHNLGTDFIHSVTGVRWKETARENDRDGPAEKAIEFEAVIRQGAQEKRRTLIEDLHNRLSCFAFQTAYLETSGRALEIQSGGTEQITLPMYGHALNVKKSKNRTKSQRPGQIDAVHVPSKRRTRITDDTTHIANRRKEAQTSQHYAWECSAEQLTRDTSTSITRKRAEISRWMCLSLGSSLQT